MLKSLRLAFGLSLLSLAAASAGLAQDIPVKQKFVATLQNAIRSGDKDWLASHMRYPAHFYGRKTVVIRGKPWLVKNYKSIIGAKLRAAVLAQDPENVFENWQGLMVGEGSFNIWVRNTGNGQHERYEIVTINDAE